MDFFLLKAWAAGFQSETPSCEKSEIFLIDFPNLFTLRFFFDLHYSLLGSESEKEKLPEA